MTPHTHREIMDSYRLLAGIWENKPRPRTGRFPFRRVTQEIKNGSVSAYDLKRWQGYIAKSGGV